MTDRLIVLAAGQGTRLRPYTDHVPKCMVPLHGRPLLHWQLDAARHAGIDDVAVVSGYRADALEAMGAATRFNNAYATTNMVRSLWSAADLFGDGFLMAYGDIVYEPRVLEALRQSPHDIAIVVDRAWLQYWRMRSDDVLADAESLRLDADGRVREVGQKARTVAEIQGQYIGMVAFRGEGLARAKALYQAADAGTLDAPLSATRSLDTLYMTDFLQALIDRDVPVHAVIVDGGWLEVDTTGDLELAHQLATPSDASRDRLSIRAAAD
jgi:choline kinase